MLLFILAFCFVLTLDLLKIYFYYFDLCVYIYASVGVPVGAREGTESPGESPAVGAGCELPSSARTANTLFFSAPPIPPHLSSLLDPLSSCLSLEKDILLRDKNQKC